jgi:hypothetical protein
MPWAAAAERVVEHGGGVVWQFGYLRVAVR